MRQKAPSREVERREKERRDTWRKCRERMQIQNTKPEGLGAQPVVA